MFFEKDVFPDGAKRKNKNTKWPGKLKKLKQPI